MKSKAGETARVLESLSVRQTTEFVDRHRSEGRLFREAELDELSSQIESAGGSANLGALMLQSFDDLILKRVQHAPQLHTALVDVCAATSKCVVDRIGYSVSIGRYDDGSHLLVMDSGFLELLTSFGAAVARSLTSRPHPGVDEGSILLTRLALTAQRFIQRPIRMGPLHVAMRESEIQVSVWGPAFEFAIAHEYAHVLLGHTELSEDHDLHGLTVPTADSRFTQELAADRSAFEMFFADADALSGAQRETDLVFRLLGIRGLFLTLQVLEDHAYVRAGKSHPRGNERWQQIRRLAWFAGMSDALYQCDMLWYSARLDESFEPVMATPSELLAQIHAAGDILNYSVLPDAQWAQIAYSEAWFALPSFRHEAVLRTGSDTFVSGWDRTLALDATVAEIAASGEGFSWWDLFNLDRAARPEMPGPREISIARVLASRHFGVETPMPFRHSTRLIERIGAESRAQS